MHIRVKLLEEMQIKTILKLLGGIQSNYWGDISPPSPLVSAPLAPKINLVSKFRFHLNPGCVVAFLKQASQTNYLRLMTLIKQQTNLTQKILKSNCKTNNLALDVLDKSSVSKFAFGIVVLIFKTRAGQFQRSVANGESPLQGFFKKS